MNGGPLLCLSDLLHDLAQDPPAVASLPSSSLSTASCSSVHPNTENLRDIFERTYTELDSALKSSDHSWINLTQELYIALISANKVIKMVNSNFKVLEERITGLKSVLERGNSVMANLDAIFTVYPKSK